MVPKNLTYKTSFTVMPDQTNYMYPMIFGGAFFSELDKAAACAATRAIYDSECDSSVTHKAEVTFHAPAECGDIIFIEANIVELRRKAIVIEVEAKREKRKSGEQDKIANAWFVFVSRKNEEYHPHNLEMPTGEKE